MRPGAGAEKDPNLSELEDFVDGDPKGEVYDAEAVNNLLNILRIQEYFRMRTRQKHND